MVNPTEQHGKAFEALTLKVVLIGQKIYAWEGVSGSPIDYALSSMNLRQSS